MLNKSSFIKFVSNISLVLNIVITVVQYNKNRTREPKKKQTMFVLNKFDYSNFYLARFNCTRDLNINIYLKYLASYVFKITRDKSGIIKFL